MTMTNISVNRIVEPDLKARCMLFDIAINALLILDSIKNLILVRVRSNLAAVVLLLFTCSLIKHGIPQETHETLVWDGLEARIPHVQEFNTL